MYEITVINRATNEENILFGYSIAKAFEKAGYTYEEWKVIMMEYID